jgi:hypothetical protein
MGQKRALVFFLGISAAVTGQVPQTETKLQPYCADSVSEFRKVLNDGTVIQKVTYGNRFCRDSSGRTRTESRNSFASKRPNPTPVNSIALYDPVAGYRYNWDPAKMIVRRWLVPPVPKIQSGGVLGGIVGGLPSGNGPKTTSSSLGAKMISGVEVKGTLTTTLYPTGSADNDRPFTVTFESWFSKQIGAMVNSTRSDPRTGDTIEHLENLVAGDPDPTLFQPPAGQPVIDR